MSKAAPSPLNFSLNFISVRVARLSTQGSRAVAFYSDFLLFPPIGRRPNRPSGGFSVPKGTLAPA